jgi:uncharacterized protein YbjT (DUF2867 family)
MMKVLVLGGNGFIGRQVVSALRGQGALVTIASRENAKNQPDTIAIKLQNMQKASAWKPILVRPAGQPLFDVVINCVGILRQRKGESYDAIHTKAPETLAKTCAQFGIRLVHISALGLSFQAKSRFIRSKFLGEQAILTSGAQINIVRAPLLDGEDGFGAKWFRRVATWPVQFVMQSEGMVAPLQVRDLGEAIANLVMNPKNAPPIVELGGDEVLSIPDYLQLLRARRGKSRALQITLPPIAVRHVSHMCDALNWTPLSFGHFELMQGYNVPAVNSLPALLCRAPSQLGIGYSKESVIEYARQQA